MKTFEIFLTTGQTARVTAAKMERNQPATLLNHGSVVIFLDESGGVVGEFVDQEVIGITQTAGG